MKGLTTRRPTKGWFNEPYLHRLAAQGIKTKKTKPRRRYLQESLPPSVIQRDIGAIKEFGSKAARSTKEFIEPFVAEGSIVRKDIEAVEGSVREKGVVGTAAVPFERAGDVMESGAEKVKEKAKVVGHEADILRTEGLVATRRLATGIPESSETFIPSREEAEGLISERVLEKKQLQEERMKEQAKADLERVSGEAKIEKLERKEDSAALKHIGQFTVHPKRQRQAIIDMLRRDDGIKRLGILPGLSSDTRSAIEKQLRSIEKEREKEFKRVLKAPVMSLARKIRSSKTTFVVTPNYIRERHIAPQKFKRGSFRTIDPGKKGGTLIVIGRLKGRKKTSLQSILHENTQENRKRLIESGVEI